MESFLKFAKEYGVTAAVATLVTTITGLVMRGIGKIVIRGERAILMAEVQQHDATMEERIIRKLEELKRETENKMMAHAAGCPESKSLGEKYDMLDDRLDRLHDTLDEGFQEMRMHMHNFEIAVMSAFNADRNNRGSNPGG